MEIAEKCRLAAGVLSFFRLNGARENAEWFPRREQNPASGGCSLFHLH